MFGLTTPPFDLRTARVAALVIATGVVAFTTWSLWLADGQEARIWVANFAAHSYSVCLIFRCKSPNLWKNPWLAAWQDELLAKVLKELRRRLFHIARDVAVIAKATRSLSMVYYLLHVQCFVLNSCRSWDDKCWSSWPSPKFPQAEFPASSPHRYP